MLIYICIYIYNLIPSAPESLNTLNELAQALANDPNHATTVFAQLATKASTAYVDGQLVLKANQSTTYTKTEVDNALAPKATTAYVDGELALNANKSDMTAALALKADQSTTYTKTEVNTHLSGNQYTLIFQGSFAI